MSSRFPILSGPILGMAVGVSIVLAPTAVLAGPTELLVPAYFYPRAGSDWDRLEAAARQVSLTVILNPASGPGKVADPNYVKVTNSLRAAGGSVVAYVSTSYGARDATSVRADIAKYTSFYKIDGFFIDEMANTPAEVEYYAAIYSYIKSLNPRYRVFGNPGTRIPEEYLTTPTADTLVTLEGTEASYANAKLPPYTSRYPASRFANIVHGVETPTVMLNDLALAAGRNVGVVYLTDNSRLSNPYSRLPTYFDQEVAAVRAASAVPEPRQVTPPSPSTGASGK